MNTALVDGRQEGINGTCLGHTRYLADVWTVVAVHAVGRMIDDEQVAVAPLSGVFGDTFAVAVCRMAVQARLTNIGGPQTVEGCLELGDVSFKELLATVEGFRESHLGDCGRLVFIAALRDIHGGAFLATRQPLFSAEVSYCLADILFFIGRRLWFLACRLIIVLTSSQGNPHEEGCHDQKAFS